MWCPWEDKLILLAALRKIPKERVGLKRRTFVLLVRVVGGGGSLSGAG